MKAKIEICMDTAAFDKDEGRKELVEVLKATAENVKTGLREFSITDDNGKHVGTFRIIGQPRRFSK